MNEKIETTKIGEKKYENKSKNYTRRLPNIELFQSVSKDGRYQIVKRVETFVIPINYIKTVMGETKGTGKQIASKNE